MEIVRLGALVLIIPFVVLTDIARASDAYSSSHSVLAVDIMCNSVCSFLYRGDTAVRNKARRVVDVDDDDGVPEHGRVALFMLYARVVGDVLLLREEKEVSKVHVANSETRRACRDLVGGPDGRGSG